MQNNQQADHNHPSNMDERSLEEKQLDIATKQNGESIILKTL
jgi:hypothetical protein